MLENHESGRNAPKIVCFIRCTAKDQSKGDVQLITFATHRHIVVAKNELPVNLK